MSVVGLTISERDFQEQVTTLARLLGWSCYHTHDSRRSRAGWPDLALWRGERLILAELKTEKGRVTKEQREVLDGLGLTPAEVYLWRPSDWDALAEVLK